MHIFKFFLPIIVFGAIALPMYAAIDKTTNHLPDNRDLATIEAASGDENINKCVKSLECTESSIEIQDQE